MYILLRGEVRVIAHLVFSFSLMQRQIIQYFFPGHMRLWMSLCEQRQGIRGRAVGGQGRGPRGRHHQYGGRGQSRRWVRAAQQHEQQRLRGSGDHRFVLFIALSGPHGPIAALAHLLFVVNIVGFEWKDGGEGGGGVEEEGEVGRGGGGEQGGGCSLLV